MTRQQLEDWGLEFIEDLPLDVSDLADYRDIIVWVKDNFPDLMPEQIEWLEEYYEEEGGG